MTTIISDDELFKYAERAKGKVVVLTGGANGIGKEVALAFSERGAKVVIGDLDVAGAEAVVSTITTDGGKAAAIKCNVTSWDDQLSLFEFAFEKYGAVDIVIPNAGITENARGQCLGDLKVVDGKPVAPKLATLEVNLIAVFYTVHLGMHYIKRNRAPDSWKAIVMMGSVASWQGISMAPQYTASKHGVLGIMRALDAITAEDNIRIAVIHPWFADTSILGLPMKVILAGIPLTPIPRIAGAVFRAATDPDTATSGCPWVLPDDGPVIRVEKEALRAGVYEMLNGRIRRIKGFATAVKDWVRLVRDLGRIFRPVLYIAAIPAVLLAVTSSRGLFF
ncbi:NAD(P)-binding protein [Russula ochroleuca]|uniref:NAD(P)-binding protein n=1 Tax=Russula ochroleuca TaxID=152965 RepID=A0A9P5N7H0_9AGAM|nr:NAD(P)-binding protein [Russula ochroleuca]